MRFGNLKRAVKCGSRNTRGGTTVGFVTTAVLSAPRCSETEVPAFSSSKFKAVIRIKLGDTWIPQRVKILKYVACDCEGLAAKEEIFLNAVDPKWTVCS